LRLPSGRWEPLQQLSKGVAKSPQAAVSESGAIAIAWTSVLRSHDAAEVAVASSEGGSLRLVALPRAGWNNCLPRVAFSGRLPVVMWVSAGAGQQAACDPATNVVPSTIGRLLVSTLGPTGWTRVTPAFGGVRSTTAGSFTIAPAGTVVLVWAQPAADYRRTSIGAASVRLGTNRISRRRWR
jgi:hypothetical protein